MSEGYRHGNNKPGAAGYFVAVSCQGDKNEALVSAGGTTSTRPSLWSIDLAAFWAKSKQNVGGFPTDISRAWHNIASVNISGIATKKAIDI